MHGHGLCRTQTVPVYIYTPSSERDGSDGRKDADGRGDGRIEPRDFANGVCQGIS